MSLRGNDLELYVFANRRLQQKGVMYLTLSHSLSLCTYTLYTHNKDNNLCNNIIIVSALVLFIHIQRFGLITNITSVGS